MYSFENKGIIVYVGPFSFPDGGAAARRILGNARAIQDCGYKVIIGSGQMTEVTGEKEKTFYKGFEVYSLGERIAEHRGVIKNIIYLVMGRKTVKWLDRMNPKPVAVILYSGYSPYFLRLLPWCKKNNIPLIFDAVEWYQAKNHLQSLTSPYYWNIEWAMRGLSIKARNIIAISSYLNNYYENNGCRSAIVPPTIDTREYKIMSAMPNTDDKLSLAYTGSPGHKDLFGNCLEATLRIDPEGDRMVFKVAGLTEDQILRYAALRNRGYSSLPPSIQTIGKVGHAAAIELVGRSDFSILQRDINRVSTAGFPTKIVESLTVGTPVICNLTSDLDKYIHDGEEGILCKGASVKDLITALEKALKLKVTERKRMRLSARRRAEISFDYRNYISLLNNLILEAISESKNHADQFN